MAYSFQKSSNDENSYVFETKTGVDSFRIIYKKKILGRYAIVNTTPSIKILNIYIYIRIQIRYYIYIYTHTHTHNPWDCVLFVVATI